MLRHSNDKMTDMTHELADKHLLQKAHSEYEYNALKVAKI